MKSVYFDHAATTPVDRRVLERMLPFFCEVYGNPSELHKQGREARVAVDRARVQVAAAIGAGDKEIVFTAGGTESDNLALFGYLQRFEPGHFIIGSIEHPAVMEAARALNRLGWAVDFIPVDEYGTIDLDAYEQAFRDDTRLASVMFANNVIGTIQPVAELARIAHEKGAVFHTDAVQAVGSVPIDVQALGVDMLTISGHKLYGPKGIGALYVRRRPRVRLVPLFHGGGQERGLRSGTLPTPLCVGLGAAAAIAAAAMADESARLARLARRLLDGLRAALPETRLHGSLDRRIPGNLNVGFPGIDADRLLAALPELSLSTGSACSSAAVEPSYVIRALGLADADARAALRIGLGRFTTEAEIDFAVERLAAGVRSLRRADAAAGA